MIHTVYACVRMDTIEEVQFTLVRFHPSQISFILTLNQAISIAARQSTVTVCGNEVVEVPSDCKFFLSPGDHSFNTKAFIEVDLNRGHSTREPRYRGVPAFRHINPFTLMSLSLFLQTYRIVQSNSGRCASQGSQTFLNPTCTFSR